MGLPSQAQYSLKEIFHHPQTLNVDSVEGIAVDMQPNSVRIFEIKTLKGK
jgi:hypothetical protein